MTDRDTFAAAALAGLIASREWPIDSEEAAHYCYRISDAMLAERDPVAETPESRHVAETCRTTNHDAAPAARAAKEPLARESDADGTGDTRAAQEPAAWGVYCGDDFVAACKTLTKRRANQRRKAGYTVAPLYAAPPASSVTLTDAEREAVERAAAAYAGDDENDECARIAATLRGLLARSQEGGR